MREIRFRAWDKKEKRMILPADEVFTDPNEENDDPGLFWISAEGVCARFEQGGETYEYWVDGTGLDDKELILLEYTGLKDKKGKKIWEGDILKIDFAYCGDMPTREHLSIVTFQEGQFMGVPSEQKDIYTPFMDPLAEVSLNKRCEVIGNIYENQRLLSGENDAKD